MKQSLLYLGALLLLASCGTERQYEVYDKIQKEADITLTEANHPHGWKQSQCFMCHVKVNIHQANRINSPVLEIARDLVEQDGIQTCNLCHGENGF